MRLAAATQKGIGVYDVERLLKSAVTAESKLLQSIELNEEQNVNHLCNV